MSDTVLLTSKQVKYIVGIRHNTIYRLMCLCQFPDPIQIAPGSVRWRKAELEA